LREDVSPQARDALLESIGPDAKILCDEIELLICYATGLLAAVVALVVLNGAIDRLG
jgi:DNA polymerase III delta subunit